MNLTLTIPGEPIAQPRAKATTINGMARMYTPKKNGIADYKAAIRIIAANEYRAEPLDVPVCVDCLFVFPRPGRLLRKKSPQDRVPHTSLRDRDNLDKAVLDALTGIVWKNDKLVWSGTVTKVYAAIGEQPHTQIAIRA